MIVFGTHLIPKQPNTMLYRYWWVAYSLYSYYIWLRKKISLLVTSKKKKKLLGNFPRGENDRMGDEEEESWVFPSNSNVWHIMLGKQTNEWKKRKYKKEVKKDWFPCHSKTQTHTHTQTYRHFTDGSCFLPLLAFFFIFSIFFSTDSLFYSIPFHSIYPTKIFYLFQFRGNLRIYHHSFLNGSFLPRRRLLLLFSLVFKWVKWVS